MPREAATGERDGRTASVARNAGDGVAVSVCIPTFNDGRFLVECLASVLSQSHAALELRISDDASTDGSFAHLREVSARDSRVVVTRNPVNVGAYGNANLSAQGARGDVVILLQGDDAFAHRDHVSELASAFTDPSVVLAYTGWQTVDEHGRVLSTMRHRDLRWEGPGRDALPLLLRSGPWPSACAFRRRDFEAVGGFRPGQEWGQDLFAILLTATRGRVVCLPSVGVLARVHGRSLTGQAGAHATRRSASAQRAFAATLEGDDPLRAVALSAAEAWELPLAPSARLSEATRQRLEEAICSRGGGTLGVLGAGALFRELMAGTALRELTSLVLADTDPSVQGTTVAGHVVVHPQKLQACGRVLVASQRFQAELIAVARSVGVAEERLVTLYDSGGAGYTIL